MPAYPATEVLPAALDRPEVRIRRSARRKKTVSARWDGDRILLLAPAGLSRRAAEKYLDQLLPKLLASRDGSADPTRSDAYLEDRAEALARDYLDARVRPREIRWVTNQNTRWGSTTPATGTIRISHHLQGAPGYVIDYVIHHELCHLIEASHDRRFKTLEARYPEGERAKAFLDGLLFGRAERGAERD